MTNNADAATDTVSAKHRAKKRFGQNFLHDQNIIEKIVRAIQPKKGDSLVEIGPGLGALTAPVLSKAGAINVVELDQDVLPHLRKACDGLGELHIHSNDALKFDYATLQSGDQPLRLIGNLPYNISSPLLFHLLEQPAPIRDMHFMLQLEVVQRMVAEPGNKQFGRLTVMLAYHAHCELLFKVPPGSFSPPPKVMSAIVRLIPHTKLPWPADDYELFSDVVRAAFNQRRKTLSNSLKPICDSQAFEAAGVNPKLRPEQLSCEQFVELTNAIHRQRAAS